MLLGFISLLLTIGEGLISKICISEKVAATWHPCTNNAERNSDDHQPIEHETGGRRLLAALLASQNKNSRRILAAGGIDKCAAQVHQL